MSVRSATWILLAALLLGAGSAGHAATVFSSEGYGWWWDVGDAASRGRGGTSVAAVGYAVTGSVNPAGIALSDLSYGFVSYSGEVVSVTDGDDSYRQRADLLPLFGGVVALPKGLRVGGMLRVQTDASYERERLLDGAAPGLVRTEGRGGWNRLQINLAGPALDRRFFWGVGLARLQGIVKEEWEFDFDDPSSADMRQAVRGRLKGGWIGSGGAVLLPVPDLRLGVSGSIGGSSRMIQGIETLSGASFQESISGRQEFPSQLAFGIAGSPVKHLSLSADVVRTFWGSAGLRTTPDGPMSHPYHDTTRLAAGLEYGRVSSGGPRRTYRLGYAQSESYVRSIDDAKIRERVASIGLRGPLGRGRAALDIALEYGKRGDRNDFGVEETFLRLSAGISFSSTLRQY